MIIINNIVSYCGFLAFRDMGATVAYVGFVALRRTNQAFEEKEVVPNRIDLS